MNSLVVNNIRMLKNRIEFEYDVTGEWIKYFNMDEAFFVEYSKDISNVPKSLAIIPFLCNILPLAWIFNAEIILDELDKSFFDSIEDFKLGYKKMYSQLKFAGKVLPNKLIDNKHNIDKTASFFSGGVDAYNTLITHIEEKPILVTLWGADVSLDDSEGWNRVENSIKEAANKFSLEYITFKSSLMNFINYSELYAYVFPKVKDDWWHGFQHGIGLIGHMAPLAYKYDIGVSYIASSYTATDIGQTCASDPTIDNYVRFGECRVSHDGYEYTRQMKIERICNFSKSKNIKIELRVCWESSGGSNCCHCEKCFRTILGILAEKDDPRDYGFNYGDNFLIEMSDKMKKKGTPEIAIPLYTDIPERFKKNYSFEEMPKELKWIYYRDITHVLSKNNKELSIYDILDNHIDELEERNQILEDETNKLSKEMELVESNYLECKYKIDNILDSNSYRIGCMFTWLPRKVKGGIRCIKENGFVYTIKLFFKKIRLKFQ